MTATMDTVTPPTLQEQAPTVLSQLAGYVGHRTIAMGLRSGLIAAPAATPDGATPDDLAGAAFAAGVLERTGTAYRLAPHLETLLLDALTAGARIVDTACGAGGGVIRLAETYPACHVIGVDGDPHSVDLARQRVAHVAAAALLPRAGHRTVQ